MRPKAILTTLLLLVLAACAHGPPDGRVSAGAPVILVSIDGFRADYLDAAVTPNLAALAATGVRAEMRPSFPSKTYPNHYTLVTGLRPDHHGLVDNNIEDAKGRRFSMADRAAVGDRFWWDEGEPIWVAAERAGLRTAPLGWPGSEAAVHGIRPAYWAKFDAARPSASRVDDVLELLARPLGERPRFLTLYFDEVDTFGHEQGPGSEGLRAALGRVDKEVGRLTAELRQRGLAANLIVVSDHGMAETRAEQFVALEDVVAPEVGRPLALGAFLTFFPAPGREAEAAALLLRPHDHMTCWKKGAFPERFHYGLNPREPPFFCLMQTGWEIGRRAEAGRRRAVGGNHGYDPYDPSMRALFIAEGPAFRRGVTLRTLDNVDVYPVLTRLLGLPDRRTDGGRAALAALRAP